MHIGIVLAVGPNVLQHFKNITNSIVTLRRKIIAYFLHTKIYNNQNVGDCFNSVLAACDYIRHIAVLLFAFVSCREDSVLGAVSI